MRHIQTHTTHILPTEHGWLVVRDRMYVKKSNSRLGGKSYSRRAPAATAVYRTQKEAVDAAMKIVEREPAAQVVIHNSDGSTRTPYTHGLPVVAKSPVKSSLGTKKIQQAVSTVLRERLERA